MDDQPTPGHDDGLDQDLLDEVEAELAEVELALERLDDGTYGRCDVCHRPLPDELLVEAPASRHCTDHLPLALG